MQRARLDDLQASTWSPLTGTARTASGAGRNRSMVRGEERLARIARAEGRVHDGSYGRCEHCGAAIDSDRLEKLPWTLRCSASDCDGERTG